MVGEVWAIDEASGPVQLQMSPSTIGWLVLAPAVVATAPTTTSEALNKRPAASAVRIGPTSRLTAACAITFPPVPPEPPHWPTPSGTLRLGRYQYGIRDAVHLEKVASVATRRTEAGARAGPMNLAWRTPDGWRTRRMSRPEWPSRFTGVGARLNSP
jgi:hypothetical protein